MLTLILLSNNRPKFLRRSVLFWSKFNFKLIIVDGSFESQRDWIIKNSSNNITYVHDQSTFPNRLKIAAELITTKYAIFVPDDEYFLPSMLKYCVEFLEKNHEFVAVNGLAIGFEYEEGKVIGFSQYPEWLGRQRIEEDPEMRIVSHMSSYANSLTSSVTKANLWKKCALLYAKYDFHIYPLWELEMNLILSFAGKSKTFNQLMQIKSSEKTSPPIRNNIPTLTPKNNIYNFWTKKNFYEKKILFIDILTKELLSISEIKEYEYCKNALIKSIDEFCKQKKKNVVIFQKFLILIPSAIKSKIKTVINYIKKINKKKIGLIDAAKIFEKQGVKIDFKNLNIVEKSIKSHYNKTKLD
jgi:glycosyltransferase domain-containing protein